MKKQISILAFLLLAMSFLFSSFTLASEPDATYIEGEGYILVSPDSKIRTNFCHTFNQDSDFFDDDFWGYPGLTFSSPFPDFHNVDPIALVAHSSARKILDHFQFYFNRDSFDDQGAPLISILKCASRGSGNATWTGKYIAFGGGTEAAPMGAIAAIDVYAHEFTHAIISHTANFNSSSESSALNEGFSDVMGIFAKCKITPAHCNYLFGENLGLNGRPFRNLKDPASLGALDFYHPDLFKGNRAARAHDGGTILGLAFYLISEGGTHPRRPGLIVTGLGQDLAAEIFFKTFTTQLKADSKFYDVRKAMLKVASSYGLDSTEAVKAAWDLLGVD